MNHVIEDLSEAEQSELFGDALSVVLAGKLDEQRDVAKVFAVLKVAVESVIEAPAVVRGDDDQRVVKFSGALHRIEELTEDDVEVGEMTAVAFDIMGHAFASIRAAVGAVGIEDPGTMWKRKMDEGKFVWWALLNEVERLALERAVDFFPMRAEGGARERKNGGFKRPAGTAAERVVLKGDVA